MKYKDMVVKVCKGNHLARLPHWKPDVWIKGEMVDGLCVLLYEDGEEFEPSLTEQNSDKWEVISGVNVEECMKKNKDFARTLTLKVMSARQSNYIHRLNHRLLDLYIEKDVLTHSGVGYTISLIDGEWLPKMVNGHWIPTLVKANSREVVGEAIVQHESLLNNIGELNMDLSKARYQELKVEELIELYRLYK